MKITAVNGDKLSFFEDLYERAKSKSDEQNAKMQKYLSQYKGSTEIDGDGAKNATQVRNITYELIESQVTGYIPTPSVTPKMSSEKNTRCAKSIETLLKNKRDELPFEKMNDIDERYSPIYGGSVWLIEWDNSIKTHSTVGDVRISCISPRKFIGQPNVYSVSDMEYCFIDFETTKEDIERKYGVSYEEAQETESDENDDDGTATLHVCYYRDENRRICQYIWSGENELVDIEDYYSRKVKKCKKCGKREEICECDKPEIEILSDEYETLDADVALSDGSVIPAYSPMIRDGEPVMEEITVPVVRPDGTQTYGIGENGESVPMTERALVPKMEKTVIPFYELTMLPVVIRKNTSEEDSLYGQSDCEFIRPQQQGINKVESRILEKIIKSGVYPYVPEDYDGEFSNEINEFAIRVRRENKDLFGRIDLEVDISKDTMQAERLYDQAKRILGITDSFQGQYDASAKSGVAKQVQVQQAAGRLDSKRQMKNAAYAEIDEIIFKFYLAFADEPRPAVYRDAEGNLQNMMFSRYDFIERDDAGEYYYNDGFLFSTDSSIDVDRQREMLWSENRQNFQAGAYGDQRDIQTLLIFWQNMERAHYPYARDNVDRIRLQIERLRQAAAAEQKIKQLGDENSEMAQEISNRASYEEYLKSMIGGQNGGIS